jgi:hypothetical protein
MIIGFENIGALIGNLKIFLICNNLLIFIIYKKGPCIINIKSYVTYIFLFKTIIMYYAI